MPKQPKFRARDLKPGDQLKYFDGSIVTIRRRKDPNDRRGAGQLRFQSGWWLVEGGGLSDSAFDDSNDWTLVEAPIAPTQSPVETDRSLVLRVSIPFYGREKHGNQIAERTARDVRLSINARAVIEKKVSGKWVAVEPTDHLNEEEIA